jgi:hypothetical protein
MLNGKFGEQKDHKTAAARVHANHLCANKHVRTLHSSALVKTGVTLE